MAGAVRALAHRPLDLRRRALTGKIDAQPVQILSKKWQRSASFALKPKCWLSVRPSFELCFPLLQNSVARASSIGCHLRNSVTFQTLWVDSWTVVGMSLDPHDLAAVDWMSCGLPSRYATSDFVVYLLGFQTSMMAYHAIVGIATVAIDTVDAAAAKDAPADAADDESGATATEDAVDTAAVATGVAAVMSLRSALSAHGADLS